MRRLISFLAFAVCLSGPGRRRHRADQDAKSIPSGRACREGRWNTPQENARRCSARGETGKALAKAARKLKRAQKKLALLSARALRNGEAVKRAARNAGSRWLQRQQSAEPKMTSKRHCWSGRTPARGTLCFAGADGSIGRHQCRRSQQVLSCKSQTARPKQHVPDAVTARPT